LGTKVDAGRVAARPGEAGDKTMLDRIIDDGEDDRNCRCRSSGRNRERNDHGHATADQVSHQRRQAIELVVQPVVFDHHVPAFNVAGFTEPLAEGAHKVPRASPDPG
jgi:hypothetical protein